MFSDIIYRNMDIEHSVEHSGSDDEKRTLGNINNERELFNYSPVLSFKLCGKRFEYREATNKHIKYEHETKLDISVNLSNYV